LTFILNNLSSPSLSQLMGTVFAGAKTAARSVSLNGTSAYAEVTHSADLNSTSDWTVEAWFKDEDPNGFLHDYRQILMKGDRDASPEAPYFILGLPPSS